MRNLRIFAALLLAFAPAFLASPAHASAYDDAVAALAAGQQEVIDAQAALASASAAVQAASESRALAQAAYNDPSNSSTVASTVQTTTSNVVRNGTFDGVAHWPNVLESNTVYTGNASPIVINGKLKGSYTAGVFILQTGTFPAPTRQVEFAVDVWNYDTNEGNRINNPDYYRIEFRTYAADGTRLNYYNLQWSQWHDWLTRGATYTLDRDAVSWDVGFRMQDNGYWAGAFGPEMDNVRIIATMTTGTPEHTVIDPVVVQALQTANLAYDQAVINLSEAQNRYQAAVDALPGLEASVTANAPTESPSVASESPTLTESASVSSESSVAPTISPETETTSSPVVATESPVQQEPATQSPVSESTPSQPLDTPSQSPVIWDYIINEGGVLTATAPTNMLFSGVIAYYVAHDTNCGIDVSATVSAVFIGTNMATIEVNNGVFTDPCPGWYKKLTVAFTYANDPSAVPTQSPTVSPEPTPEPTPTPTPTPQPQPEPTLTPTPEPTPTPTPSSEPTPEPTPLPTEEPSPEPSPTPEPEPTPVEPEPTPNPEPEPSPTPTPEPTPTVQPTPEPSKPAQPSPTPAPEPVKPDPTPAPTPKPNPEPTPVPEPSTPPVAEVLQNVANVDPTTLTETQVAELKEAALATFETAEPGSEEYEAALDALLIAAQADDIVIDEELASAPVIGAAVVAIADALNALGNAGADMSPQVREQSEKVVIAAVIVGQVAMTATAAATSAAAAAARRP